MKGYIICATQRSGSTMVCEDLRDTNVAGIPKEYFNKPLKKISENIAEGDKSYVDEILKAASTDNGVVGLKVMANQIVRVGNVLKVIFPEMKDMESDEAFFNYFKDYKFIYLKRKSVLKQAVSRLIARQTGIYHIRGNKEVPENYGEDVKYNYDDVLKETQKVKMENRKWSKYFKKFGISYFELKYEDVAKNTSYVKNLFDYLEIDGEISSKPRKMKKISSDLASQFVEQFKADKAARKSE